MPLQGNEQIDDNNNQIISGYDPTTDRLVWLLASSVAQDATTGKWYGTLQTSGGGGGGGGGPVTAINGAFVAGAIVDLTSLLMLYGAVGDATSVASVMGRLAALKADLDAINTNTADLLADGDASATAALQTTGNTSLASIKTDLDNIYTQVQLLGTQTTAAAMKADLDSIVTNTATNATAANQATTNTSLASIATQTQSIAVIARAAQEFIVSGSNLATATNPSLTVCTLSLFNPIASGKTITIFSLQQFTTETKTPTGNALRFTTTDPATTTGFTNIITPLNAKAGGAASVASASSSVTGITASITATGTLVYNFPSAASSMANELLTGGAVIVLTAGNGIELTTFVSTAGDNFGACAKYTEQ